jgi:hypothetical protein
MSKISNTTVYPNITPEAEDFVILTDVSDSDSTKTCTLDGLSEYLGTKSIIRTLTNTECLSLGTNPVVLATCATGEFIQVTSAMWKYNHNNTAFGAANNAALTYNGVSTSGGYELEWTDLMGVSLDVTACFWNEIAANGSGFQFNPPSGGASLTIQIQGGANPPSGDGTISLNIQYRIAKFT